MSLSRIIFELQWCVNQIIALGGASI